MKIEVDLTKKVIALVEMSKEEQEKGFKKDNKYVSLFPIYHLLCIKKGILFGRVEIKKNGTNKKSIHRYYIAVPEKDKVIISAFHKEKGVKTEYGVIDWREDILKDIVYEEPVKKHHEKKTRTLKDPDEKKRCPRCKRLALKLVYYNDNRTGRITCIRCKRELKKIEKENLEQ